MQRAVKQPSITAAAWMALACALLLAASSIGSSAAERHSLAALHAAVIEFVTAEHAPGAALRVIPDALDPRLRLSRCAAVLEAFWAPGSARTGQVSVGLRCPSERPWTLYVPTRVELRQEVLVAARALVRGQRLTAQDLRFEERDVGTLRDGAIHDPAQVTGYLMTRPLAAGRVLSASALAAPRLVERGRPVRIALDAHGVYITMSGLAMDNGALGETVRVRNPASQRVVEGVVVGPAQIRLRHLAPQPARASRP